MLPIASFMMRTKYLSVALAWCLYPHVGITQELPGASDYAAYCATCHGTGGHGDGPMRDALTRPPRDLTMLSMDNGGAFPETLVYQVIDGRRARLFHGTREMPVWGQRFSDEGDSEPALEARIDRLIRYLEYIQSDVPAS